ncbi:MAG: glucosaminidase domain-containing protein [Lachnospiraceae bacterium]
MKTKKRIILLFGMLFAFSVSFLFSLESKAATKNGWVVSGGKTYYKKSGKKVKGLQKIGNYYYYFDSQGKMTTGWKTINGKKFYFKKTGAIREKGKMFTGWHTIDGKTYYFKMLGSKYKIGSMFTGWHTIGKKYFYFNKSGHMLTGSYKISGKTFYFKKTGKTGEKGSVFTGTRTVNNITYYYRTSGKIGTKGALYKTTKKVTTQSKPVEPQSDNMTNAQFVSYIGNLAREDMKKTGILASVTIAQAILESGYGKSGLAKNANNLFGIKAGKVWNSAAWNGKVYKAVTKEYINGKYITIVDSFRFYDSWEKSVLDHSYYLRTAKNGSKLRYPGISTCRDYRRAAQIIKNGGYATAPNYVEVICNIIRTWNLTKYDL